MPWCPVCHAEYREGVKVCRQCQAGLVDTPPAAGEHYTPPAESALDTMAEALTQRARARGWGQQIGQGFRLFGESFPLMLRMRNAWLVLAILTALATVSRLRPPQPIDPSALAMLRETGGSLLQSIGRNMLDLWYGRWWAVSHVSADLRTGLDTPLAYFSWLYGQFSFRLYPAGAATRTAGAWHDPRLLAGSLALTVLGVFFIAGMLRWVLAAVRAEEQTAARFWEGVRQSFWPLLAWTIVINGARSLAVWPAARAGGSPLSEVIFTAVALLLLPLLFTSKVIVVLRPPVYLAPVISARIFARNLLVLLGFAVPFIVLHDIIWGIDRALHFRYYAAWDPEYTYRYVMPALALAMQFARVAVEVTITTAFVILVARWKEADHSEPAPPEAASA